MRVIQVKSDIRFQRDTSRQRRERVNEKALHCVQVLGQCKTGYLCASALVCR